MSKKGSSRKGSRRRREGSDATASKKLVYAPVPRTVDEPQSDVADHHEPVKLSRDEDSVYKVFRRAGAATSVSEARAEHNQPVTAVERTVANEEADWGMGNVATANTKQLWKGLIMVLVLLFLGIALVLWLGGGTQEDGPKGLFIDHEAEEQQLDGAIEGLLNDPETHSHALRIIEAYVKAESIDDVVAIARQRHELRRNLQQHWRPCVSRPMLNDSENLVVDFSHTDGLGFYTIQGRCEDESPFIYYFVREEGRICMDWEASMAIGDEQLKHMAHATVGKPLMMRVVIEPSPYYLLDLEEADYESYRITVPGEEQVIWGYVKRGTPEHGKITTQFGLGGSVLEATRHMRAVLRLAALDGHVGQNRFMITEMLHKEWLLP